MQGVSSVLPMMSRGHSSVPDTVPRETPSASRPVSLTILEAPLQLSKVSALCLPLRGLGSFSS